MKTDRIIQSNEEGKNEENEEVLKKIQNSIKWSRICRMGIVEGKERKRGRKITPRKNC